MDVKLKTTKPKPLMLIGPSGAGKSTLLYKLGLDGEEAINSLPNRDASESKASKPQDTPLSGHGDSSVKNRVRKTEAITYFSSAIDTPGEMLTIPQFYNALILNSIRARLVLFLMDAQRPSHLPPRMALAMKAPVIGVISKIDSTNEEKLKKARSALTGAGIKEIYEISSLNGTGLEELKKRLES